MNDNLHRHSASANVALAATFALFLLLLVLPTGHTAHARQNAAVSSTPATPTPAGVDSSGQLKLTVTVTDKAGRNVTGLRREAFSVSEGKSAPELSYFSGEELPQSVGVIFDVSKSMSPAALEFARGALVRFMRQAHASNEYFAAPPAQSP